MASLEKAFLWSKNSVILFNFVKNLNIFYSRELIMGKILIKNSEIFLVNGLLFIHQNCFSYYATASNSLLG